MGKLTSLVVVAGVLVGAVARADTNDQEIALQRIQEQQQATFRAVEQARQDAEVAAKRNADAVEARFKQIEENLNQQRNREVESLENAHRYTLTVVVVVAALGFLAMLIVALFLLRSMNRRAGFAPASLDAGSSALVPLNPAQQSS